MSTDTVAGETWRKGAGRYPSGDGDYVELVVPIRDGPNPVGGKLSVQMPEWLADAILRLKDEAREVQQGYERQLTKAGVWAAKAGLIQGKLDKAEREVQRLRTALETLGRCSHCGGDGSPQCVTCDDYQWCHCKPGQGKYADKCWACEGTGISNRIARAALEASKVNP
jgi:hypothetical protein